MSILTHERIKLTTGILAKTGVLWGENALQSITIARHTPKTPQQAIGYLGIVDYTSGTITSDLTLATILVEGCDKADAVGKTNSVYKYAGRQAVIGTESYVLTSVAASFTAGNPATVDYGYLTSGIASFMDAHEEANTPDPSSGEESDFAVVMGDDGSGCKLLATWDGVTPETGYVPIIDGAGVFQGSTLEDEGVPAGVSSLNFNARINRDTILDFRSAQPVQWVTTYPVDITTDIEIYEHATTAGTARIGESGYDVSTFQHIWDDLAEVSVVSTALGKHRTYTPPPVLTAGGGGLASDGDVYVKAIGMEKVDETDTISVNRYTTYTINFTVADLLVPLPDVGTL